MPRVTTVQSNFTAGEISPRLYGRTDLARYMAGAKEITNGIVLQHGGIRRRDGTIFVAEAGGTGAVRLIRYVFNRDQAYCLEFGAGYIRFFTDNGAVVDSGNNVYQISTTYTEDELFAIRFCQTGNEMFLAHPNHPLAQLSRLAHDSWTISDVTYLNQPVKEDTWKVPFALELNNTTVGDNRYAYCPIFRTADYRVNAKGENVSRRIFSVGGGEAIITGTSSGSPTTALRHKITVVKAFESTTIEPYDWWMDGQPQCALTITGSLTAGSSVVLSYGPYTGENTMSITNAVETTYYGRRACTINGSNAGGQKLTVGDMIKTERTTGEVVFYTTTAVTGNAGALQPFSATFPISDSEDISTLIGTICYSRQCTETSTANVATAEDIDSIISINSGYVKVTEVYENRYAGTVTKTLSSSVAPGPNAWAILRPAWTDSSGYPSAVTSFEQRLVVSGTAYAPNTVWLSKIGNYYDFLPGSLDDDAMAVTIASSEQADIVHLEQTKGLIALTSSGEVTFMGGVEKPITPTNIQIKGQSVYGSSIVKPQRIGNELYFVQRAGRKLRAFSYKYESDDYGASDLSIMSEHLTQSGVKDMAYVPEPESILWMCLEDGGLVSVTIERENDVVAWCDHETDGLVESLCSVPSSDTDTLWMVINRDGNRYIERMAAGIYLDSAVEGSTVSATDTWSGLDHLEGKTVSVVADGVVLADCVVTSGAVTLSRAANDVVIGLPYTTTIETLMQDFGTGTGSIQGNSNRIGEVSVRYMDTVGCKINGDYVAFRRLDTDILDSAPTTFTGLHRIETLGWNRGDVTVTLTQEDPLPFHIQQVIFKFQSND